MSDTYSSNDIQAWALGKMASAYFEKERLVASMKQYQHFFELIARKLDIENGSVDDVLNKIDELLDEDCTDGEPADD